MDTEDDYLLIVCGGQEKCSSQLCVLYYHRNLYTLSWQRSVDRDMWWASKSSDVLTSVTEVFGIPFFSP